ncbi:serine/threonine-protein kinase [Planktothrix sp. FACHB-1365]|uniref:serine/threonine protein kinase n=1 Tax=Planktothrix sp. FACHB-1365 TaxID=2692855 RepID=UPI0016899F9D|nr:serine/threonine-protein kinase [Planktothrix sp. FACHB-1365]MBD2484589.1 serine/threonine protein kinase [Planktothrix sp. FACHB-1365]
MGWQPGEQLRNGQYTIIRELGRGRFGITYLARDKQGETCVIKTLSDDLINQLIPSDLKRLEDKIWQEATKLAHCQHPHIVKLKESFKEGDRVCLAMEHIAGETLEHLPNKILSESVALEYIRQIGSALICVHEKGFVHRDVKPANIVLRAGKSEVVLIDFGLARGFDNPLTTVQASTTDGFAPLELYHVDSEQKPYTDAYSLSATLYVLLTGTIPASAMDRSLQKAQLIPPKQLNSQISDRTNTAILEGLKLAPEDRPQTINEWLKLLPSGHQNLVLPQIEPALFWTIVAAIATVLGTIAAWTPLLKPSSPPIPSPSPPVIEQPQKTINN